MFGIGALGLCFLVISLLSLGLAKVVGADNDLAGWFYENGKESAGIRHLFRGYLGLTNLLIWGLAAVIWARWMGHPWARLRLDQAPEFPVAFHAAFLLMVALPAIFSTVIDPETLQLPEFLSGAGEWLQQKEDLTSDRLKLMMLDASPVALAVNLLVVAVVPAISEELFFRGFLLQTLWKRMHPYIAIVLSAFLFSAIHLQLAGFFPRFLLGIILGLVFYYSRNLWLSSVVHFSNNALAVLGTWMGARKGAELPEPTSGGPDIPITVALVSVALAGLLIWWFFRRTAPLREKRPLHFV